MATDSNEQLAMRHGLAAVLSEQSPVTDNELADTLVLMMTPKKNHHKIPFWTDPNVSHDVRPLLLMLISGAPLGLHGETGPHVSAIRYCSPFDGSGYRESEWEHARCPPLTELLIACCCNEQDHRLSSYAGVFTINWRTHTGANGVVVPGAIDVLLPLISQARLEQGEKQEWDMSLCGLF